MARESCCQPRGSTKAKERPSPSPVRTMRGAGAAPRARRPRRAIARISRRGERMKSPMASMAEAIQWMKDCSDPVSVAGASALGASGVPVETSRWGVSPREDEDSSSEDAADEAEDREEPEKAPSVVETPRWCVSLEPVSGASKVEPEPDAGGTTPPEADASITGISSDPDRRDPD